MKLSKKYGGLQFFGAPARGILQIYNNEGTKVFDANVYGGDSPYTISLQENIVTVQYTTSNGGVCLNGEPSVNTENISVTAEPSSNPTKTTITLPFAPTKIHFGSGTGEASVPLTNYVEVAQGASIQVTEYGENTGLYSGGGAILQYFGTATARLSVDLATAFPDKWAALSIGKHTLQIRAKNPGNYLDSDLSTAITFTKVVNWTINITATNCTADASNPTVVPSNTTAANPVVLKFNKATGYKLPTSLVLDGIADDGYTWSVSSDGAVGTITIVDPSGNITGTVAGAVETYNITVNATNALAGTGNPTTIGYGLSATLTFTFPTGYEAPASVDVTGATPSWTAGTGTLVLSNPTGPVTVNVVGVATTTTLDGGTYKWHDSINLTEWLQDINFTSDGTSYKAMRYTGDGTAMTLQYEDADSEWTTVYNYNEDTSTGSWVNDNYKTVDLGTSAQTVTAIFKADFIANTTKLTQLATPQNVTADGTNVSWDEVENATSYEVIEGGNNVLGTVTATPAVSKNWKFNGTKTAVPQQSVTKKASINGKSYNDSTFVEDFVGIYGDADWSYIAFGSAGYWDTSNNTWGAANILKFNDEPSGDLLVFLKAHAQAID